MTPKQFIEEKKEILCSPPYHNDSDVIYTILKQAIELGYQKKYRENEWGKGRKERIAVGAAEERKAILETLSIKECPKGKVMCDRCQTIQDIRSLIEQRNI